MINENNEYDGMMTPPSAYDIKLATQLLPTSPKFPNKTVPTASHQTAVAFELALMVAGERLDSSTLRHKPLCIANEKG